MQKKLIDKCMRKDDDMKTNLQHFPFAVWEQVAQMKRMNVYGFIDAETKTGSYS